MKKLLIIISSLFMACFILYISFNSHLKASNISYHDEYYYNEESNLYEDGSLMSVSTINENTAVISQPEQIDTVKDSTTILVNKEYSLPADYVPVDLVVPDILFNINYYDEKKLLRQEAATAMENLFSAASEKGLALYGISGYRSYARQEQIYNTNIRTKGEEYTNRYSAKPGFSEHQTGLVLDVSTASIANRLEPVFAYTPEGKWLAENAYKYGFIIRYPKDKESITGYSYEPWHLRYVGEKLAKYLHDNHFSLEEYYGYKPSESINNDLSYDNVVDIDETTDKKELTEPTPEEIEKVSHTETNEQELEKSEKKEKVKEPEENSAKEDTNKDAESPAKPNTTNPPKQVEKEKPLPPSDDKKEPPIDDDVSNNDTPQDSLGELSPEVGESDNLEDTELEKEDLEDSNTTDSSAESNITVPETYTD